MNTLNDSELRKMAKDILPEFPDKVGYDRAVIITENRAAAIYIPNRDNRRNIFIARDYFPEAEYCEAFTIPDSKKMMGCFMDMDTKDCIFLPLYTAQ